MIKTRTCLVLSLFAIATSHAHADGWSARKLHEISGFQIPECVAIDADNNQAFVSNVAAAREGKGYDRFWVDDGTGFISQLKMPDRLAQLKWRDSSKDLRLSGPKGLCVHDGAVWTANITHVVRYPLKDKAPGQVIKVPGADKLNDMATDGKSAYVTDIAAGKCYRLNPDGEHDEIKAPDGINGICFHKGRMFAASWGLRDIYELDPTGKKEPRAFGLTAHFTTPDGIEVLDDGSFIVSDSEGNRVYVVSTDEKKVSTLIEMPAPADIGLDRARGHLYVPLFFEGRVEVYKLEKN